MKLNVTRLLFTFVWVSVLWASVSESQQGRPRKLGKCYLVVQCTQRLPSGPIYVRIPNIPRGSKGILRSKVDKGYLMVQGMHRVPKGPRQEKGDLWPKVVQFRKRIPSCPM